MDPVLTPSLLGSALTKFVDSAATAAGAKAWESLKALIARHRGSAPSVPTNPESAEAMAVSLTEAASSDPDFSRALVAWSQSVIGADSVANSVSGQVQNLVQGRDISGPIVFNQR